MRAALRLGFFVLVCVTLVSAPAVAETEPGERWENTIQMTMEGMSMPPTTTQTCRPRNADWNEPPGATQDDCEVAGWKMTGSTATWSIRCKDGTTGTGEATFDGRQSYHGTMTVKSSEGTATMKLSGRLLGGDCDVAASRRQVAAMQQHAAAMQQQGEQSQREALATMCREAAEGLAVDMFLPPHGMCSSAEDKAALCAQLRTAKGFDGIAGTPPYESPQFAKATSFCGTEPDALREALCAEALEKRSYPFLGRHCPGQRKTLADAECAGRKFTAIPDDDLRGFCMTYASQSMSAEGQEPKKESKSKKILKGLLGR